MTKGVNKTNDYMVAINWDFFSKGLQVAPGVGGAGQAGGVRRNLSVMSVALTSLGRRWPLRPGIVKPWFICGWGGRVWGRFEDDK